MFDINSLTYLGEVQPESGKMPPNTLLLQLDNGFYLFPPKESWKSNIRPAMVQPPFSISVYLSVYLYDFIFVGALTFCVFFPPLIVFFV